MSDSSTRCGARLVYARVVATRACAGGPVVVTACPAALVDAPVERVWSLLVDPRRWDEWADARFEAAEPEGTMKVGQRLRFSAAGLGRRWTVRVAVRGVAPERHSLDLEIATPLGVVNHEHVSVTEAAGGRAHVVFG